MCNGLCRDSTGSVRLYSAKNAVPSAAFQCTPARGVYNACNCTCRIYRLLVGRSSTTVLCCEGHGWQVLGPSNISGYISGRIALSRLAPKRGEHGIQAGRVIRGTFAPDRDGGLRGEGGQLVLEYEDVAVKGVLHLARVRHLLPSSLPAREKRGLERVFTSRAKFEVPGTQAHVACVDRSVCTGIHRVCLPSSS